MRRIATAQHALLTALAWAGLLALAPSVARAEQADLAVALAAYRVGESDRALSAFEAALRAGGLGPADLVTVHVHLGVLRGAAEDLDGARRSFEAALALDPTLPTPDEIGGQQRALFDDLRAARAGQPLQLVLRQVESVALASGRQVEVSLLGAPPGLVSSIQVEAETGVEPFRRTLAGATTATVTIPGELLAGGALRLRGEGRDEYGNVLTRSALELLAPAGAEPPIADTARPTSTPITTPDTGGEHRPRHRWPWYRHPAFWVPIGCVIAGGVAAGVVLGTYDGEPSTVPGTVLGAPQIR